MTDLQRKILTSLAMCEPRTGIPVRGAGKEPTPAATRAFNAMLKQGWVMSLAAGTLTIWLITDEGREALQNG